MSFRHPRALRWAKNAFSLRLCGGIFAQACKRNLTPIHRTSTPRRVTPLVRDLRYSYERYRPIAIWLRSRPYAHKNADLVTGWRLTGTSPRNCGGGSAARLCRLCGTRKHAMRIAVKGDRFSREGGRSIAARDIYTRVASSRALFSRLPCAPFGDDNADG